MTPRAADEEQFQQNLADAIAWCSHRLELSIAERGQFLWRSDDKRSRPEALLPNDLAGCLRSQELKTNHLFEYTSAQQVDVVNTRRAKTVESLAQQRSRLLRNLKMPLGEARGDLSGGRILVYEPDYTLSDGGSWSGTGGYIDGNVGQTDDVPPWDSWVAYVPSRQRPFLLSYVPPSLIELADDGILTNCSGCLFWLDGLVDVEKRKASRTELRRFAAMTRG